jgi:hypothetical protein
MFDPVEDVAPGDVDDRLPTEWIVLREEPPIVSDRARLVPLLALLQEVGERVIEGGARRVHFAKGLLREALLGLGSGRTQRPCRIPPYRCGATGGDQHHKRACPRLTDAATEAT